MGIFATEHRLLLDPVDRVSEILFGLIMAVTIVGSLSIATAGQDEIRTVMMAALGCNLTWVWSTPLCTWSGSRPSARATRRWHDGS